MLYNVHYGILFNFFPEFVSGTKIAGQSTEYVNRVLDKVKGGVSVGALDDL